MKTTKTQTEVAKMMIMECELNGQYVIKSQFEHKVADMLVKAGAVKILKKKNYGRIEVIG